MCRHPTFVGHVTRRQQHPRGTATNLPLPLLAPRRPAVCMRRVHVFDWAHARARRRVQLSHAADVQEVCRTQRLPGDGPAGRCLLGVHLRCDLTKACHDRGLVWRLRPRSCGGPEGDTGGVAPAAPARCRRGGGRLRRGLCEVAHGEEASWPEEALGEVEARRPVVLRHKRVAERHLQHTQRDCIP